MVVQTYARLRDGLLAYEFQYPTSLHGQPLPMIQSRRPERYSSAAPLTADARQACASPLPLHFRQVCISAHIQRVWVSTQAESLSGL